MQKNNDSKKAKLPIKRIISDNLFILGLVHKSVPGFLAWRIFFSALQAIASFFTYSYLLRYALNGINEGKRFSHIALFVLLCTVAQLFVSISVYIFFDRVVPLKTSDLSRDLRIMLFEKARKNELRCYENPEYYDKFSKAMDECVSRAQAVIQSVTYTIAVITSFSANFALVFAIDPVLLLFALIPLACIPISAAYNKTVYQKNMDIKEENRRKDYSRRTFYLADYAKEMRLTNMPVLMLQRFRESGERVIGIWKKYGFTIAALGYIKTECIEMLSPLSATLYAVWQTLGVGTMGYGDCVVVINSISSIAYTLTNSADTFLKFQEHALYIENLREFLEYEPTLTGGSAPLPAEGDLVLNHVSFRYEGAAEYALRDVSIHLGRNEKIAIVGHNGAGKTTLVKLLLRLYDPEGTITYGGTNIKNFPIEQYRDVFSTVMQDCRIFAVSAAENVLLRPKREGDDALVADALKKSGLWEKVSKFPHNSDTMMTREFDPQGEQLSGGEAQKLAIAHVYSKENRYVILDEPSSALDPIAEHEMYERMSAACANCGMIFISHRLSSAVSADRIYLMENGTVAEAGTHAELMAKNGRYAEMFRHQAENYTVVTA